MVHDGKSELRRLLRERRLAVPSSVHDAVATHASEVLRERRPMLTHIYLEKPGAGETGTDPILRAAVESGVRVCVPVVDPVLPGIMRLVGWNPGMSLQLNRFGIPEPTQGEEIDPADVDLWFVPALGADRSGNRIGHGAGYYDRMLADARGFKVAPLPEACLLDRLPTEPHDVRMDAVVTELGLQLRYL